MSVRPKRNPVLSLKLLQENYFRQIEKLSKLLRETVVISTSTAAEDALGNLTEQHSVATKHYGLLALSLKKAGSFNEADQLKQEWNLLNHEFESTENTLLHLLEEEEEQLQHHQAMASQSAPSSPKRGKDSHGAAYTSTSSAPPSVAVPASLNTSDSELTQPSEESDCSEKSELSEDESYIQELKLKIARLELEQAAIKRKKKKKKESKHSKQSTSDAPATTKASFTNASTQRDPSNTTMGVSKTQQASTEFNSTNAENKTVCPLNPNAQTFQPSTLTSSTSTTPSNNSQSSLSSNDLLTKHFLISNLKKEPSDPFSGEPHRFHQWIEDLKDDFQKLSVEPKDAMKILVSHSAGKVKDLIIHLSSMRGNDPQSQLNRIIETLEERFGDNVEVSTSIYNNLLAIPPIKGGEFDPKLIIKVQQLSDQCELALFTMAGSTRLSILNDPLGLEAIKQKLPFFLIRAWKKKRMDYGDEHPPFSVFCDFLKKKAKYLKRDSNLTPHVFNTPANKPPADKSPKKTTVFATSSVTKYCQLHKSQTHDTTECTKLINLNREDKIKFMYDNKLCFKCLQNHKASSCKNDIKCNKCGKDHITSAHLGRTSQQENYHQADRRNYNPDPNTTSDSTTTQAFCTKINKTANHGNFSRTLLVDVFNNKSKLWIRVYAIVDEQSSHSFCSPSLVRKLKTHGPLTNYTITSASEHPTHASGQIISGLQIRKAGSNIFYNLPPLFECNLIPDSKRESATKEIVSSDHRIAMYAHNFYEYDHRAECTLLLGRDNKEILASTMHRCQSPYVIETPLGWAVLGEITSNTKTYVTQTNRDSVPEIQSQAKIEEIKKDVFHTSSDDNTTGPSVEDLKFLHCMENATVNERGHIEAPLPMKHENPTMPDNSNAVYQRQTKTLFRIQREPEKMKQCLDVMEKYITRGHVTQVSEDKSTLTPGKSWHLPIFPVFSTRKKARLVFDSAAKFNNTSLNSQLLSGPDQNNKLHDVLLRFREKPIAFVGDIESMFHCFFVSPEFRDFQRFYWWRNNDPSQKIVPYKANVHIFGNTSSPAVATLCLRKAATEAAPLNDSSKNEHNAREYITDHFYCDDGLGTANSEEEAIDTLKTARSLLSQFHIRLHKVQSNSSKVLEAFPESERATSTNIELSSSITHRTLGISWNTATDNFTININLEDRPYTKRGILSIVNSIYDPIGLVSPVILGGRCFLRKVLSTKLGQPATDWDEPLPEDFKKYWNCWLTSLKSIHLLSTPRCLVPANFSSLKSLTLHVFSDASEEAIGNVTYLKAINTNDEVNIAFVNSNSRVTPKAASTIPKLELCAATEAVIASQKTCNALKRKPDKVYFYTDSKVCLGFILNEEKRFTRYVQRRVNIIHQHSSPDQWHHVKGESNPADYASRPTTPLKLSTSNWFLGPEFLRTCNTQGHDVEEFINLPSLESEVTTLKTLAIQTTKPPVLSSLLTKYGAWSTVLRIATLVVKACQRYLSMIRPNNTSVSISQCRLQAQTSLIREVQSVFYSDVVNIKQQSKDLPQNHKLAPLVPFLDEDGLLRVGGRLRFANLPENTKHPVLLPSDSPLTNAILLFHHRLNNHSGRLVTQGAIREAGYHIENGKRSICKLLQSCVTCRRLRASPVNPIMADLPTDRCEPSAPFTSVGTDVFGPWNVCNGQRTRKNAATRKCWALIFVCLSSRAVHIECLSSLDTPSFINALRRFISIRGPCSLIRSDRGTNFIGALNQSTDINFEEVDKAVTHQGVKWIMNSPTASHFSGSWERKIGQIRRSLDAALLLTGSKPLTQEELLTLLAESTAIVNSTPLWENSTDPNEPPALSPQTLLTQKYGPQAVDTIFTEPELQAYGSRRWRKTQALADAFWKQWRKYYLLELNPRKKWHQKTPSLQNNDIVLIADKNCKRNSWPTGVVSDLHVSHDGVVRSATVRLPRLSENSQPRLWLRPCSSLIFLLRPPSN